jgi:hypothetical protein
MGGVAGTFFLIGVGSPLRAAVSPPARHRACRDAELGPFQARAHATVPRLEIPFDLDLLQSCVSDIIFECAGQSMRRSSQRPVSRLFEIVPTQSCPYRRKTSRHSLPTRKL